MGFNQSGPVGWRGWAKSHGTHKHLLLLNTLEKGGRPQDVVLREASF